MLKPLYINWNLSAVNGKLKALRFHLIQRNEFGCGTFTTELLEI